MNSPSRAHRHPYLLMALVVGLASCGPADSESTPEAMQVAADPAIVLLDSVPVFMQRADVPGLQLAYVESGEIIATAAFGYADSAHVVPVTDATVF